MNVKQNYKALNDVLKRYGLSFADIEREFNIPLAQKMITPKRKTAKFLVLPNVRTIRPREIANGSYGLSTPSLKFWFEYDFRNETIMKFLGNHAVIDALQSDRHVEFVSNNGRIFLLDDGNHRLFNYLLLYLIESKRASSSYEQRMVENKFSLIKHVHHEHDAKMVDYMFARMFKEIEPLPLLVKGFLAQTSMCQGCGGDYFEYNPEANTYNVIINGREQSNVPESVLMDAITDEPELPEGVKLWRNHEGGYVYYIALHNKIIKTRNPKTFAQYYEILTSGDYQVQKPQNAEAYMITCDVDNHSYDVLVNSIVFKGGKYKDNFHERIVKPYRSYLKERTSLYRKLNADEARNVLGIEDSTSGTMFYMPQRHYNNLTEAECKCLLQDLDQELILKAQFEESLGD